MVKVAKKAPVNKPTDYLKYEGGHQWWVSAPNGEAILQQAETGVANYAKGIPLMTVPQLFEKAMKSHPTAAALRSEMMNKLADGEKPPGPLPLQKWETWTWKQYYVDSRSVAKAMIKLGFAAHDSCNIFGFNSPEWLMSMQGAIMAGGKAAGIYPSDTEDSVQFKSDHSNGSVAVVEDESCLNKFKAVANNLPWLKCIVTWACQPGGDIKTKDGRTIKVLSWSEFIKIGQSESDDLLNARLANIKPSHCCALIYTSGTTGNPKAVMISHDNMIFTAFDVLSLPHVIGLKNEEERIISYLPLSHVAGAMVDVAAPMALTSNLFGFKGWLSVNFARSYDLKKGTLVDRLTTIQPTIFLGVPRVWEKIMEKLRAVGATTKGLKKALSTFAKKRAAVYTSTRQLGGTGKTPANMFLAKLILKAILTKLGLIKAKFMFSGAAPMTMECLEYFGSLGINVNEVYGMSECTGAVTWSTDNVFVWGSVGFEISGCEVRVLKKGNEECPPAKDLFASSENEQGEICFRGRSIMMGYMANPRLGAEHMKEIETKNIEAIDKFGFLHSGDKGTRDERGMIKITGRYKELIKGAGGENIAPVPIEDEIKRLCPFVSNVMMIGNLRKFNVCVVTLKAMGATGELPGGNQLAPPASTMSQSKTITEAMNDDVFIKAIEKAITETNKNTKVVPSNAATIQKFTILPRDFSVQTGELTATLKLKRQVVDDEFKTIIDYMYTTNTVYVPYFKAPVPGLYMGEKAEPVIEKNLSMDMNDELEKLEKEAEDMEDRGEEIKDDE